MKVRPTQEQMMKVLDEYGSSCHGGNGKWNLPENDKPGDWMPEIEGELLPCKNGYHLCREQDLIQWLGPTIYEAEYEGELIEDNNKVVVRKCRLVKKTKWNNNAAIQFAADCAEHVLHIFEEKYPDDDRPRKAIEAARSGDSDAARAAANAAWTAAADDGARAAAYAAWTAAAYAAAYAAAWADAAAYAAAAYAGAYAAAAARAAGYAAAAWAAAADAVRATERKWQTERLLHYLEEVKE